MLEGKTLLSFQILISIERLHYYSFAFSDMLNNQITTLPQGIFHGLSALYQLYVRIVTILTNYT